MEIWRAKKLIKRVGKIPSHLLVLEGIRSSLADKIGVTKQAIFNAIKEDRKCKGFKLSFYKNRVQVPKKSTYKQLQEAIALLKRSSLIIDENNVNACDRGEYPNRNIVSDIERFLKK